MKREAQTVREASVWVRHSMTLIDQLKQIPDPRNRNGRSHPLWMILLGFLCGYRGYRPLADFCKLHQTSLRELLQLSVGKRTGSSLLQSA